MIGTRLGPYEVLAKLGEGGMGEVYRATDTNLGRQVAIKVLPEAVADDPERLARFDREARTLAALNHPNIAQIYGLERADGVTALVMELVEGPTLEEAIRAKFELRSSNVEVTEWALPIAKQIADALEAAHEQGIIHRDLKPANIKVRDDGTVKVLDFGLAKAMEPASASAAPDLSQSPTITTPAMTELGMILGTAAYMSPEQAKGRPADRRSDVWAFGAVLFEMLTGRRAFAGEDVSDTLASVLAREPDWSLLPPTVPPVLKTYLRRCLQKDRRQRIGDIHDVRLALDGAFDVRVPEVPAAGPDSGRLPPWLRYAMVAGVAAVLAVGLTLIGGSEPVSDGGPVSRDVARFDLLSPPDVGPRGAGAGRHLMALSPDGTRLVYWAGSNQLYLRPMDRLGEGTPIRGTDGAREPFFSPDGRQVGFYRGGILMRVAISGGAPVAIGEADNPWGATWDSDGMIRYGQGPAGIWQVSAENGGPEQVLAVEEGESAHGPQLLPGGDWMLFTLLPAGAASWDEAQVVAQSLTSDERVVVAIGRDGRYLLTGHVVFGLAGDLLAVPFDLGGMRTTGNPVVVVPGIMDSDLRTGAMHFSVSATGSLAYVTGSSGERRMLVWRNVRGDSEPLNAAALPYSNPAVEPGGQRIALQVGADVGLSNPISETDIQVYDPALGTPTPLTPGGHGHFPLWAADGRRIVFFSSEDDGGLFLTPADGSNVTQRLTTSASTQVPLSWSRDGRTLLLEQRVPDAASLGGERRDVYTLRLDDDELPQQLLESASQATVSPNGEWIAYTAFSGGQRNVWVDAFPDVGTNRVLVSPAGGYSPLWAPDGRTLYFVSPEAQAMAVPVADGPVFRVAGTPRVMFDLPPYYLPGGATQTRQWAISTSESGDRFLVITPGADSGVAGEGTEARIVLVQNWFEELKQLVPAE